MLLRSLPKILTFDAFHLAGLSLKQSTFLTAGETLGSLWLTERQNMLPIGGTTRKRIVNGAAHLPFYDDEDVVSLAVEEVSEFMKGRLL